MACTITNLAPLGHPCTPQMGGIKYVYLLSAIPSGQGPISVHGIDAAATQEDGEVYYIGLAYETNVYKFKGWAITAEDTAQVEIETIRDLESMMESMASHVYAAGRSFNRIDVTRQGAVVTSEATVNKDNNTVYYRNAVSIPTVGLTPDAVALVRQLGTGGVVVVAETYSGQLVAFGFEDRATLDAASLTTGANWGDMPGATIILAAEESVPVLPDLYLADFHGLIYEGPSRQLADLFRKYFVRAA